MVVHKFGAVIRKHFPQHKKTQVLDCPSCGKDDQLWFPIDSAMRSGVGCYRCRLKITREFPRYYPKSYPENVKPNDSIDWMYLYSFFILLKTWNRLPRRKKRAPV